ncbi:MAG: hypothetical protein RIN55_05840 [Tissierellaceae bacterium]|nr:hypothetical protein [Tissierellaceae bacterium]
MIKRILGSLLIIMSIFTSVAHANSGPTYWEGYPSLEILAIQESSPIVVDKEKLTFDFTSDKLKEYNDYSKAGSVTAAYQMSNPTNEKTKVQMAFPIISKASDFYSKDVEIKVNGENLPFKIYIGDNVNDIIKEGEQERFDFDKIVSSISNSDYIPRNYNLSDKGKLYKFNVQNPNDVGILFQLDFEFHNEKTKIISNGFNSYQTNQDTNKVQIGSYIHNIEDLELLVIGQDIDFNITAYIDQNETTDNYSYNLESESIKVRDYLIDYFDEYIKTTNYKDLPYQQLLNLYLRNIDDIYNRQLGYIWADEFFSFDYFDLVFVLIYEVEFIPHETNDVSISYITKGTMDRKNTVDPLYTFEYILNPAEKWADFKDLNIEIIPSVENPYIIESSLELERNKEGLYIGRFESLPENDLTFTLYSKEKVTFMDKVEKFFYNSSYLLFPLLKWLIIAIMSYIIVKLISKLFSRNKDKNSN